jgi:hypothetical protein
MGRRIQRVHEMAAKREQDVMPTFYRYEFRDLDLLESVSAAGFTCVHVHSTGVAFGLREVAVLNWILRRAYERVGRSRQGSSGQPGSREAPSAPRLVSLRDLLGPEVAESRWSRPLLPVLRQLFGHVLLIVARAE